MAVKFADEILPAKYGYPFKVRIPTKLGFKNPKWVTTIFVTNRYPGRVLGRSRLQLVQRIVKPNGIAREGGCAIAVMAKAPVPGQVKTRLVPPLTPDMAAALSAAFLRDITENIALAAAAPKYPAMSPMHRPAPKRCLTECLPRTPVLSSRTEQR